MTTSQVAAGQKNDGLAAKSFAGRFIGIALAMALLVCAVGWFTDLRQMGHAALLTCATFAFLPFLIIMAGIALTGLMFIVLMIACLFGHGGDVSMIDSGADIAQLGGEALPGYYRFLARQRHPFFWGIPAGTLIGGLVLWGFVAVFILPGEARTAQILIDAQIRLEQEYEKRGGFPAATDAGHILLRSLGDENAAADAVLLDGFGRPVEYKKWGLWKVATWSLRSAGYDGKAGRDDLCRHGGTKLGRFAEAFKVAKGAGGKGISVSIQLGSILESQCKE
jgi:hypothetical protein